jgi:hypothetical protein
MKRRQRSGKARSDQEAEQAAATELAIAALTFIAEDPERLGRFLALSGVGPESLRTAAREPNFLLGILDYMMSDEAMLVAFAEHSGIDPMDVGRARDALAGEMPAPS